MTHSLTSRHRNQKKKYTLYLCLDLCAQNSSLHFHQKVLFANGVPGNLNDGYLTFTKAITSVLSAKAEHLYKRHLPTLRPSRIV